MPERLTLTQNAQFYREDVALTNEAIRNILDAASDNKTLGSVFLIDQIDAVRELEDGSQFRFSLRVFPTARPVHFWGEPLSDLIHALILIIQIDGYVAVLKKSCASVTEVLERYLTPIKSSELTASFSDEEAEFQKIAMRNMTVSERAMRSKAYEAADLKGLLSLHAAGRSIPYFFKLKLNGQVKTISAQSGRVVESSERKSLNDVVKWVRLQIEQIKNPSGEKEFLEAFAQMVELDIVWDATQPTAALIESSFIVDNLLEKDVPLIYTTKRGRSFELTGKQISALIHQLEKVYEVNPAPGFELNGTSRSASLKKNKNSISLSSPALRKIKLEENGKERTLQAFINKNDLITISFANPQYMYFMGQCFKDGAGLNEIPSLLKSFVAIDDLALAISEKGDYKPARKKFDANSVFGIIEKHFSKNDYVFCDDLGDEWADHIAFNKKEHSVSFIHSKHGDVSKSASNLHDVVGQAIKNIGNMDLDLRTFIRKYDEKILTNYRDGTMPRIRKKIPGDFKIYLTELRQDYRFNKRCIICCSFLSKALIESEFGKLHRGVRVPGNITQMFWILSSFVHATKEAGASPIIYCRP
ncbi:hypothetical protein PSOLE_10400 [Pseudomonas oleovorans subsp. oleovorans]|uniref:Uncharacterized protein n=2 Tax=Ectopseudomonas TaxID=3236654 RepID=A0A379JQ24_ECTOL|nr:MULTISPECIES: hypothetical protein [Pseudomonas aeruginosa group]MDV7804978.1 hypothetical protein [Pseudomonas aeruginosa]OWK48360.1 hypothetical protein PSOLE_10400 [Pseudomonas oleovorans subsp. oleovorans]SEJ15574.1 hypothetical protein SAMN05216280_101312 [Pseudomonas oleovorans]SUD50103.1 Uncharacterised protein [Pseudomonas oleovorans]HEP8993711.1 hypothetical protein [Pseudomonas aeruginosa]